MAEQSLTSFLKLLPGPEAFLVIRKGSASDLEDVRAFIRASKIPVLKEIEFSESQETRTFIFLIPPHIVQDIVLELVGKGIGGQLEGYEAKPDLLLSHCIFWGMEEVKN